jgi:RNA polymerase sigma-70 factor (ECF subfamily)
MKGTFEHLVEPHRARLRLHCYRMLGSSSDADDVVQETLARAFRSRHTLEDDGMVRPWLYRIATNVCIDELKGRSRRARGPELGPPSDPDAPPAPATAESEWLEPCPSAWLDGADPASAYSSKESIALAFVAALQVLTPAQRGVLLLRDVVGLTAEEAAIALEISVSAANSTLHRAREALATRVGPRSQWSPDAGEQVDRSLLERYLRVWEASDLAAIIALLHEDVILSMPPHPTWLNGRSAVARFFTHRVRQALEAHRFRTLPLEANGRPAVAFYRRGDDGVARLFAVQVLELEHGRVRVIDHFMATHALRAFFAAGLPTTVASEAPPSP